MKRIEWQTGPLSEAVFARPTRELTVVVVEDSPVLSATVGFLCDYLSIRVEVVSGRDDLDAILQLTNPMAVMSAIEGECHDGFYVLKTVAAFDPSLPVLLVTGVDPIMVGAVGAVEELWGLEGVQKSAALPGIGDVVEFLFRAGRTGDGLGAMQQDSAA